MLNISLAELVGRAQEQLLAQQAGLAVNERHCVLQLIAKTKSAARLVGAAARPQPARQGLVHEPAVGQDIKGTLRGFHLHGTEGVIPVLPNRLQRTASRGRATVAVYQVGGVFDASPHPEPEDDLALLPLV